MKFKSPFFDARMTTVVFFFFFFMKKNDGHVLFFLYKRIDCMGGPMCLLRDFGITNRHAELIRAAI